MSTSKQIKKHAGYYPSKEEELKGKKKKIEQGILKTILLLTL